MPQQHVVVTGAGGYVGRHVVRALLDRGARVTAVDRRGNDRPEVHDARASVLQADALEPGFIDRVGTPDALLHLAWQDGFKHNAPSHMANLSAHWRVLTDALEAGVQRVSVLGSMHEVGYWEGAIDADTPTHPLSQYGVAKNALRQSLLASPERARVQWLRCFYILGDDRNNHSVFTRMLEAADEGRTEFPFTSGQSQYDFIKVEDLAEQIAAAVLDEDASGIINCCSGEPRTLRDQAERFIAEHGLPLTLQLGAYPDRPYDSPGVWGDATRIREIMERDARSRERA